MLRSVSAVFFLAMVPHGLMATELGTAGYRISNVQDTAAVGGGQYRHPHKLLPQGGARTRGWGRRGLTSQSDTPTDMDALLDLHNEARCLHNADPLTYSDTVATSAMAHAQVLSSSCGAFYHSASQDRNGYGENLYLCATTSTTSCYTPEGAMTGLYDSEIQADTVAEYGGHATQILWKSTTELGCAVATCDLNAFHYVYLVCQYNPPGNYMVIVEQEVELPTGTSC